MLKEGSDLMKKSVAKCAFELNKPKNNNETWYVSSQLTDKL